MAGLLETAVGLGAGTSLAWIDHNLFGRNLKARQYVWPKSGYNGHICCVATTSHQHSSNPWRIEAGIKDVPLAAKICLEPAREIHRRIHCRYADVTQIARAVACWNGQAAA